MHNEVLIREIDALAEYASRRCDLRDCELASGHDYAKRLHPCDDPDEVVEFISKFQLGTPA